MTAVERGPKARCGDTGAAGRLAGGAFAGTRRGDLPAGDGSGEEFRRVYGSIEADVARGLALRMDHGSCYLSDHFLNQIQYWDIRPSFGFIEEPETNGVAERWNCTLQDVRAAVAEFVEQYNTTWRLEKIGHHMPTETH